MSTGGGILPLEYAWNVSATSGVARAAAVAALAQHGGGNASLAFPALALPGGHTYTYRLVVRNAFGEG